jgi:hypothetical protein
LSEDSLVEPAVAAAEERQLSIHSSPQTAHNRNFGEVHETKAPGLKLPGRHAKKSPIQSVAYQILTVGRLVLV